MSLPLCRDSLLYLCQSQHCPQSLPRLNLTMLPHLAKSNSQLLFLILFQHNNYLLVEDILLTWFLRHQTVYFLLIFH